MDDELEMDASGCWVRKNARLRSDIPLNPCRDITTIRPAPLIAKIPLNMTNKMKFYSTGKH